MTQPRWTREEIGLLAASLLSGFGNGITTVVLPWLVLAGRARSAGCWWRGCAPSGTRRGC